MSRGHQFVAWDVRTGERVVLERPGRHWLPNLGTAPCGVVWARGETVHREDPASGVRSRRTLPQQAVTASWGPDDTAFAYIGRPGESRRGPWRLYAGRTFEQARGRAVPVPVEPSQLLGWRDERHVVVGHHRRDVHVVDVVTGEVAKIGLAGTGDALNPALLAADRWRAPMIEPPTPEDTTDPRRPLWYAGGATVLALVTGLLLRRRRARRQPVDGRARSPWS